MLAGERGPVRDAVLLNAAGALVAVDGVGGRARPLADAFPAALERVAEAIDSGAARGCWSAGWSSRRALRP